MTKEEQRKLTRPFKSNGKQFASTLERMRIEGQNGPQFRKISLTDKIPLLVDYES